MIITAEVTEQDYRALQWSVLIDRAKLHWGVAAFLPMATLLFWFANGAEPSVALTLRVFASILGGVGLILLAVMAGQYASRNKPMEDKRVPLGAHTYEVMERSITVTSEHRRMEFPVSALQSVTETPSHFFVIVRQGTELIIPRRGLDTAQTQALQDFREVVAFSSLHIDNLSRTPMTPKQAAKSLDYFRWVSVIGAVLLPFTLGSGLVDFRVFLWAVVTGAILLGAFFLSWRTRNQTWTSALFLVLILMPRISGVQDRSTPDAHAYQFLLLSFVVASLPVLLLPQLFRRVARIQEVREEHPAQA